MTHFSGSNLEFSVFSKCFYGHVHKKMGKIGCFSPLRVCLIQWQS